MKTEDAVNRLKLEGRGIIAVEQAEGSIPLYKFRPRNSKLALVFGNEVSGVGEEVMQMLDGCVEIPQIGTKHSLNIAVSVGVVIWELWKHIKLIQ